MTAPERLYLDPAYGLFSPSKASQEAEAQLWQDAGWCYDQAWLGPEKWPATPILVDWATHNKVLVNKEAKLVMTFKGQLFLESFLLLPNKPKEFPNWVATVYRPGAKSQWDNERWSNRAAWGLLGLVLSDLILGLPLAEHERNFTLFVSQMTDSRGVMVEEIKRTNSGMWYSAFCLSALLRVAQLLPNTNKYLLLPPLNWLWNYTLHPETWPYKLAPIWTPKGIYQRLFYACAKEVELPRKNDWPANLFHVAGKEFNCPEWTTWGTGPPYWTDNFRHG